jgi:glycosyltransferase involved in cell wall biosynthesis
MRVLFVGPLPEPITGQSLACQVFLEELARHHEVDVINLSKGELKQGISSLARVFEVLGVLWNTWRRRRAADLIYLTISESFAGNLKDVGLYLLCWPQLSRMYVHLHGGAGLRRILLGPRGVVRRLNEFFLRRLGGAIVLGGRHVDIFAPTLPASKIHVVGNFADDYLFSDEASIARKFRVRSPLRLLFLSNLIPGKGHAELINAFQQLDAAERDLFRLDFAGAFESAEQEEAFLQQIAGTPQVRYHGIVRGENKKRLLWDAHVFCLPTYYAYEGQPISILEAYAAGCVVVTTDHSGIFDIFTPGINGYAVDKRSVEDLRLVLRTILGRGEALADIALTNFHMAGVHHRAATYCANMLTVVSNVGAAVVSDVTSSSA